MHLLRASTLGESLLIQALNSNDLRKFKELLVKVKPGIDSKEKLLSRAARMGNVEAAKILVRAGASYRWELLRASEVGDIEAVRTLIAAGANVNISCAPDRDSPLFHASNAGHVEIVSALINAGVDLNKTNWCGDTSLIIASVAGDLELVKLLYYSGADINCVNHCGATALDRACFYAPHSYYCLQVMNFLSSKGAKRTSYTGLSEF